MLEPRRVKYRKIQKPVVKQTDKDFKYIEPTFGIFGLKALESGRITARQLDACRKAILKKMKKRGIVWMQIFPDKSVTKKPAEVRMGKGKGGVDHWVSLVKSGRILFEIGGEKVTLKMAQEAFVAGGERLPIKTRLVIAYR